MAVTVELFREVALADGDGTWELRCGQLVGKPPMTMDHNFQAADIVRQLNNQLDDDVYSVRQNAGHVRVADDLYVVPDVAVIPMDCLRARAGQPTTLEEYAEALPFVAEIWSRSTGDYDSDTKLPAYRARGDLEIWRVHPYERTVVAWRRKPDGSYTESRYHERGRVRIESLPGVSIDLGKVFRL